MARKKVNLAWIANDSTRRVTFKKRHKGLLKKVGELATLCDIKACVIVYGPQDPHPVAWPSAAEASRLLARFKALPEMEQSKKMMNQEGFLRHRIAKLQEQLAKQERENRELESALLLREGLAGRSLAGIGIEGATSLAWAVEAKLKLVCERMAELRAAPPPPQQQQPPPLVAREKTPMEAAMEALQREKWLLEALPLSPSGRDMMVGNGGSGNGGSGSGGGGSEMVPSYSNNLWLDPYFPFN